MSSAWLRFALVEALQIPALLLAWQGRPPWAWWTAALLGAAVCILGTDSPWRWRNRLLILQAVAWFSAAAWCSAA